MIAKVPSVSVQRISVTHAVPPAHPPILALGCELKGSVCTLQHGQAELIEGFGDLTRPETFRTFVSTVARLRRGAEFAPAFVAHDLHPGYLSTTHARELGLPTAPIQHHHAHVVTALAENDDAGPKIGRAHV